MPNIRDRLIAQRKKLKGLPAPINKTVTEPQKDFSAKVNVEKRETKAAFERVDTGLATQGMKDVATPLKERFAPPAIEPETPIEAKRINTFQGKPIPEDIGMPGNVSIAPVKGATPRRVDRSSFGLPTDRLPSFAELGGAIGQMFKFVGGLTKKRQALGLIPGRVTIPSAAKGLSLTQKDRATILAKRLDDLTLTDDERSTIKAELDNILNPQQAAEQTDIDAILNE